MPSIKKKDPFLSPSSTGPLSGSCGSCTHHVERCPHLDQLSQKGRLHMGLRGSGCPSTTCRSGARWRPATCLGVQTLPQQPFGALAGLPAAAVISTAAQLQRGTPIPACPHFYVCDERPVGRFPQHVPRRVMSTHRSEARPGMRKPGTESSRQLPGGSRTPGVGSSSPQSLCKGSLPRAGCGTGVVLASPPRPYSSPNFACPWGLSF